MLLYGFPPGIGATGTAALLNVPKVPLPSPHSPNSRTAPSKIPYTLDSSGQRHGHHAVVVWVSSLWRRCWRLCGELVTT